MTALLFNSFQVLDDCPEVMTKLPGMVSPGFADFLDDWIVHFHSPSISLGEQIMGGNNTHFFHDLLDFGFREDVMNMLEIPSA